MPKRMSLIMSGAVSLGDYQAGVLTELLYALDCLSKNEKTHYELDVITGASAGSITGALVAYITLLRNDRRDLLHKAWVDLSDVQTFLRNAPTNAVLSRVAEEEIATQCIQAPYTNPSPSSFAPKDRPLRMTFTLSNLNGINRSIPGNNKTTFTSTFFDDAKTYYLVDKRVNWPSSPGNFDYDIQNAETWQSIIAYGISSGAFPFAFPPFELERYTWQFAPAAFSPDPSIYSYVDGGTFNNQPIGEAVRLSRHADGPGGGNDRKYLFVSASANNSTAVTQKFSGQTMTEIGLRVATCIFAESRVSDYIRSQIINFRTVNRDEIFKFIRELVRTNTVQDHGAQLIAQLTSLAETLGVGRAQFSDAREPNTALNVRLSDVKKQYDSLTIRPEDIDGKDPANRNQILWLLFLILDIIADLDSRQQIDIDIVAPEPNSLAGEQFAWFGGFFEQNWREYNFRKGKIAGQELFLTNLGSYDPEPGDSYTIPPGWDQFPNQTIGATDRRKRLAFRDRAVERALDLVESVLKLRGILGWLARKKIRSVITDYLNKQLEL